MGLFKRKKVERPKNPLGVAVYQFDNIIKGKLGKIIAAMQAKKTLNPVRAKTVLESHLYRLDHILEDISKENLKTDYRSDKVRYKIIAMVEKLKKYLQLAARLEFDYHEIEKEESVNLGQIFSEREKIKKDMKDIQSDYL